MADKPLSTDPNWGTVSPEEVKANGDTVVGEEPHTGLLADLNKMLAPIAHPESLSDMWPLLIPSGSGAAIEGAKDLLRLGREAIDNGTPAKHVAFAVMKRLWQGSPESNIAGFERYGPNIGKGSSAVADSAAMPGLVPKPAFSASDVARIKYLTGQGVSETDAIAAIRNLKKP